VTSIISGPLQGFDILDLYGVIGSEGAGTESVFKDGRAVRKRSCNTKPSASWDPDRCSVVPGKGNGIANTLDCDPGEWVEDADSIQLIISEVADPKDKEKNRFIELYSPNRKNQDVTDVSIQSLMCFKLAPPP